MKTFSWFYFDFISDDGLKIIIVFYHRPFHLTFDLALLDVSIYKDEYKKSYLVTQNEQDSTFDPENFQFKISNSFLKKVSENLYNISIDETQISINLQLRSLYSNWHPALIKLYDSGEYFFNWIPFLPALEVNGIMETPSEKFNLKGRGYLDYNQGNIRLNKILKAWQWGRLFSIQGVLIFGSLIFKDSDRFQPVLIVDSSGPTYHEINSAIHLNHDHLDLPEIKEYHRLNFEEHHCFDVRKFLLSKIPSPWVWLRKIHEFIFYRLESSTWGQKINKIMANVVYKRFYVKGFNPATKLEFGGIIETIEFG